jgi:hypothetical protein
MIRSSHHSPARLRPKAIASTIAAVLILAALIAPVYSRDEDHAGDAVQVARLAFAESFTSHCFNAAFCELADRRSHAVIEHELRSVALGNEAVFNHPFAVMTGKGGFELSDTEREHLHDYLVGGGFIITSNACSDEAFDASFRRIIAEVLPDAVWRALTPEHPLFHTLFEINTIKTVRPAETPILGLHTGERLVMIYSPLDLCDTAEMEDDCCCCGANEVLNARQINANALLYALTR